MRDHSSTTGRPVDSATAPLPQTPAPCLAAFARGLWLLLRPLLKVIVVVAAIYYGWNALYDAGRSGRLGAITQVLPTACTVGLIGTNASIHVEGVGAESVCQGFAAANPGKSYVSTATRYEPVVCERDYRGVHVTVRDEGILQIVGGKLCNSLR